MNERAVVAQGGIPAESEVDGGHATIVRGYWQSVLHRLMRVFASSSRPFMGDICTSEMTHDVSFKRGDPRNCSADPNVCTT